MNNQINRDVIIALDFPTGEAALAFLSNFKDSPRKPYVKVGMELFYSEGPAIIERIKALGHKIFLDLKLHDIPNTVEKAMTSLAKLDVDMCNVHAAGTVEMMAAAIAGLEAGTLPGKSRPLLIAVTQLTSTSEERMKSELFIAKSLEDTVKGYAENAKRAGLDGVVCSPLEAGLIHEACGEEFLTITPGVRFEDAARDDQVRVTTPARAKVLGSNFIVVGRPITKAENPVAAYERCLKEFI
ncbi:MAG: orotidine-5'-phosphate decarboxylase [Anaerovoracaceae bacterium]|nr:orotidine-5'-phosphate decarboxylase [Anaerovoracaceae bacterium]